MSVITADPPTGADAALPPDAPPSTASGTASAGPFNTPETVEAILGLPMKVVRQYVGTLIATSPEAVELLDNMPKTIRSLATSMESHAQRLPRRAARARCCGARPCRPGRRATAPRTSSSAPPRPAPTTSPRTRCSSRRSTASGRPRGDAQLISEDTYDDATLRQARSLGERAKTYLNHPSLRSVTAERPSGRALKRTRAGKSRKSYEPALIMLRPPRRSGAARRPRWRSSTSAPGPSTRS